MDKLTGHSTLLITSLINFMPCVLQVLVVSLVLEVHELIKEGTDSSIVCHVDLQMQANELIIDCRLAVVSVLCS